MKPRRLVPAISWEVMLPVFVADSQVCISVFQRNKESQSSPLSGFRDGPMADHQ